MNLMSTNPHNLFARLLVVLLTLCVLSCSAIPSTSSSVLAQTSETGAYWPTKGWRTSTPEAQGIDSQKLLDMLDAVERQDLAMHSLLVIRHGYIVSETYFTPYTQDTKHELYSCTKSFIATLIGIALDQEYIKSTDEKVLTFFPEQSFENLDAAKQEMTLANLLSMTSGLDWHEQDSTYIAMYQSRDWVKYVLDEPMKTQPGREFNYCSGCSHVLSAVIKNTNRSRTSDFAAKNLFEPLGISKPDWEIDATGIALGGWGIQMTPREMAKLGYLYLHQGTWDGQQIVSKSWIETATRKQITADNALDYGYQWWIAPSLEGYTALGRYGQTIFVIPRLDLIVVTTAHVENHDPIFALIQQYIVPSVIQTF
jgi:CubicO group peptidase (beta-lactamase class C family)